MKQSQLKMILAAMIVVLIATMTVAAPAETPYTASIAKQHSTTKPHHHITSTRHTTTTPHHVKPKKTTTKAHKSITKAYKPKKTTTKTHKSTSKAHKPKATTKAHKSTTATAATTTMPPTTSVTSKPTTSPKPRPGKYGQTGTIVDQNDFCIFLPPTVGGDIAANEDRAVAFCTKANMPGAPGAKILPKGFIKSAHFTRNTAAGWVQITGRINRSKYNLSPKDGGGQYDMRAPVGASFTGYNAFVQLTEPDSEIYCIRACMTKADCPVNKSTHGCVRVLGGDYS
ncbi:hypothetical protein BG015_003862 [Linnemannia schmuckeri]|uniref:Uncharacterized protein n=1 Tax=Linnemannia schmuckeri TaxID=64567 RepID=A0A9P5S4R2_9FUNG|nr:hypothetical protein BG015_003862 [Linnemannia schmuckeri]